MRFSGFVVLSLALLLSWGGSEIKSAKGQIGEFLISPNGDGLPLELEKQVEQLILEYSETDEIGQLLVDYLAASGDEEMDSGKEVGLIVNKAQLLKLFILEGLVLKDDEAARPWARVAEFFRAIEAYQMGPRFALCNLVFKI